MTNTNFLILYGIIPLCVCRQIIFSKGRLHTPLIQTKLDSFQLCNQRNVSTPRFQQLVQLLKIILYVFQLILRPTQILCKSKHFYTLPISNFLQNYFIFVILNL
jgi:hypothetical protein